MHGCLSDCLCSAAVLKVRDRSSHKGHHTSTASIWISPADRAVSREMRDCFFFFFFHRLAAGPNAWQEDHPPQPHTVYCSRTSGSGTPADRTSKKLSAASSIVASSPCWSLGFTNAERWLWLGTKPTGVGGFTCMGTRSAWDPYMFAVCTPWSTMHA